MIRYLFAAGVAALAHAPASAEPLSLEAALSRTLAATPEERAGTARLEALAAARNQAGVRLNPTLEVYSENFAGTGPYRLADAVEVTGSYAQVLERGGKRAARVALAGSEIGVAEAELVVARLDIAARVQRAYVEAVATQAEIAGVTERLRAAEALAREVDRRVKSARDPLFAGTRARTRVAEARVDLELAVHARDASVERLAALWGGTATSVEVSTTDFLRFDRDAKGSSLPGNTPPEAALIAARVRRAEATVIVEQTRRVQDVTVRAGLRYLRPADDVALVAGFSIPLGRYDQNRAGVARALAERRRIDLEAEVVAAQRRRDLVLAEERVHEAMLEAVAVRDRVVPGTEQTLAQVREGYGRGFFSYLDVADAQTALATARARLVKAARAYHEAGVDLDRLTGRFATLALAQEAR
jgi:cobalt-zinc-cadmium efflux system outer membrane protein